MNPVGDAPLGGREESGRFDDISVELRLLLDLVEKLGEEGLSASA